MTATLPDRLLSLSVGDRAHFVAALGSDLQERRLTAQRLLVEGKKVDANDVEREGHLLQRVLQLFPEAHFGPNLELKFIYLFIR